MRASPGEGEDSEEVLLELGFDWDEIIQLKLAEVVL